MASDMPPPPPPEYPESPAGPSLPWETPGTPVLHGLFETLKLFVAAPGDAFRRMPINSDFLRPLFYMIAIGWACAWVSYVWGLVFEGTIQSMLPDTGDFEGMDSWGGFMASATIQLGVTAFYPVLATVLSFLLAGILHLLLMLVGGANHGFFATYRVYCYAVGTSSLAGLIPICGGIVDMVWGIVLAIIGIAIAHRTTHARAALAVLLPLVLGCLCCFGFSAIFGIMAGTLGN